MTYGPRRSPTSSVCVCKGSLSRRLVGPMHMCSHHSCPYSCKPTCVCLSRREVHIGASRSGQGVQTSTRHRKKPGYIRCRASAHGIGAHGMPSLAGGPRVHAEEGRPFLTLRTAPRAFRSSCGCFTKTVLVMTERGGKRHLERMYAHARMGQQLPRMHRFHWWDDPSCATTTAAVCTGGQAAWHSSCGPRRSLRCGPPPVT